MSYALHEWQKLLPSPTPLLGVCAVWRRLPREVGNSGPDSPSLIWHQHCCLHVHSGLGACRDGDGQVSKRGGPSLARLLPPPPPCALRAHGPGRAQRQQQGSKQGRGSLACLTLPHAASRQKDQNLTGPNLTSRTTAPAPRPGLSTTELILGSGQIL